MFNLLNIFKRKKRRKPGKIYNQGFKLIKGRKKDILVVAFTGGARLLNINPYEFMSVTRLKKYNRLMLQDSKKLWYILGINEELNDIHSLCDFISKIQQDCEAEKLLFIGTSSGGYAALLVGHLLRADYVHVFGPQTSIDMSARLNKFLKSAGSDYDGETIYKKAFDHEHLFNLGNVMKEYNGETKYFIHYSEGCLKDKERAEHMRDVSGVSLFPYPYSNHSIVGKLGRNYLEELFSDEAMRNPFDIYNKYYFEYARHGIEEVRYQASEEGIIQIIKKLSAMRPTDDQIKNARNIPVELSLDSMACLQLMVELENAFNIEIEMSELKPDYLATIDELKKLIDKSHPRAAI